MDKLMLARPGENMMGKLLRFFEVAGTNLEPTVLGDLPENVLKSE